MNKIQQIVNSILSNVNVASQTVEISVKAGETPAALMPTLPVMIAAGISLFILTVVVSYFAYFPVKNFLADRKKHVSDNLNEAEKINSDAKINLESANKKLTSSKQEGKKIVDDYTKVAKDKKQTIVLEAKNEADKIMEDALKQIKTEKIKVQEQLTTEAIEISIKAAEMLIDKNLSTEDNKKIVDDFIKNLEK